MSEVSKRHLTCKICHDGGGLAGLKQWEPVEQGGDKTSNILPITHITN